MAQVQAEILGGACQFKTLVRAGCTDGQQVMLEIESDCPRVQRLAAELKELDAFDELLRRPLIETTPARLAAAFKLHAACPVPIGVLKAAEVAAGLALPAPCSVELVPVPGDPGAQG